MYNIPKITGHKYEVKCKPHELQYFLGDDLLSEVKLKGESSGSKWDYIKQKGHRETASWTIKSKFALSTGKWTIITNKSEVLGKMKVKAFVRAYRVIVRDHLKYGRGDIKVVFNDSQTEFYIQRLDVLPKCMAVFRSQQRVGEATGGTVRVARGELLHFTLALCSMFVLLMQEFSEKPSRYKKQWTKGEEALITNGEAESDSSTTTPRNPKGEKSIGVSPMKADADSGSRSPEKKSPSKNDRKAKPKKKHEKKKGKNDEEKHDTSATDTGEENVEKNTTPLSGKKDEKTVSKKTRK